MFFRKTVRVVIKDKNLAFEVKTGTNLYSALIEENVIGQALCKGGGQCGKCKVKITSKNIIKPTKKEQLVLAKINLDAGYRLACQTIIKSDMVVDTSEVTSGDIPDDIFIKLPNDNAEKKSKAELQAKKEEDIEAIKQTGQEKDLLSDAFTNKAFQEEKVDTPEREITQKENILEEPKQEKRIITSPPIDKQNDYGTKDGILFVRQRGQIRFFLYSSVIDGIAREGVIKNLSEFDSCMKDDMLPDYLHNNLKIEDIDRIIIMSDQQSIEGEHLFDAVSYMPFDIGIMPCELFRVLPGKRDLSLFLRLLGVKGKKKLLISLDKLNDSYYIAEDVVIKLPQNENCTLTNMMDISPAKENPVIDISDDLMTVTAINNYDIPDSVPLHALLKAASRMRKIGITDSSLTIAPRSELNGTIPLSYVVKVTSGENGNMFYIHRAKDSSHLAITQDNLYGITKAKDQINYIIQYTEKNIGHIDGIVIATPASIPNILDNLTDLDVIPKKYSGSLTYSPGDSSVIAIKLFQEPDVRSYIQKNFGSYLAK